MCEREKERRVIIEEPMTSILNEAKNEMAK
jgi:hypothetical protein